MTVEIMRFNILKNTYKKIGLIAACSLALSGCQSWYGPSALNETHPAYNQAMVNSLSQEMLLNLVRLKYRDRPYFLSINTVTASMSLKSSFGLQSSSTIDGSSGVSPDIGVTFSQSPTISYAPLSGEDFLKSILSPLPIESVLVMAQSGWRIERIFGLCLEMINDVPNAPSASGPTPKEAPHYKTFQSLVQSFDYLQSQHLIEIGVNPISGKEIEIHFLPTEEPRALSEIRNLRDLLQLNDSTMYQLSNNFLANNYSSLLEKNKLLSMRLRSIYSMLYYLSQTVEVPVEHQKQGLVTQTKTATGENFQWTNTPAGRLFQVHSGEDKPENAYISVHYRDTWFYIADNDLQTKSTFMLLTQLFNLQAGQSKATNPTLTIPVR